MSMTHQDTADRVLAARYKDLLTEAAAYLLTQVQGEECLNLCLSGSTEAELHVNTTGGCVKGSAALIYTPDIEGNPNGESYGYDGGQCPATLGMLLYNIAHHHYNDLHAYHSTDPDSPYSKDTLCRLLVGAIDYRYEGTLKQYIAEWED